METLTLGMIGAWIAISAYVGWLGFQQRRLGRRLDAVPQSIGSSPDRQTESLPTAITIANQTSRVA